MGDKSNRDSKTNRSNNKAEERRKGKAMEGSSAPTSWGRTAHSDELGGCSARSDYTLLGAVGSSEDK